MAADANRITDTLQQQWAAEQPTVWRAAETVQAGTGLFGHRRGQVNRAQDHLHQWAERWRAVLSDLPADPSPRAEQLVAYLTRGQGSWQPAIAGYARRQAEHAYPALRFLGAAAHTAADDLVRAEHSLHQAAAAARDRLARYGTYAGLRDPNRLLADTDQRIIQLTGQLKQTRDRIAALYTEPAVRGLPPGHLALEQNMWLDYHRQQDAAPRFSARRRLSAQQQDARHEQTLRPEHPSRGMSR